MVNFVLRNYTDMIYGKGQETKTAKLIKDFGGSKEMCIRDRAEAPWK